MTENAPCRGRAGNRQCSGAPCLTFRGVPRWNPMRIRNLLWIGCLACVPWQGAEGVEPAVLEAEQQRVALIQRVAPAVVAIFAPGGQGGGSGVLVSADGYTVTNFHVIADVGPF